MCRAVKTKKLLITLVTVYAEIMDDSVCTSAILLLCALIIVLGGPTQLIITG